MKQPSAYLINGHADGCVFHQSFHSIFEDSSVPFSGPIKIYAQIYLQAPADLKSANNRGVVHDRLQVLHIHVFLVAPLGARHVAKPGADQHQSGVAIGECPHHPRPSADLPIQPLDHIVGTDARPVFAGKIAVGQCLLNAVLDLLGSLLSFMARSSATTAFAFSRDAFLLSWAWIALSIFPTILTLDLGTTEKTLR